MTIYLDFDGTVVEHAYPALGKFNPNALEVIKQLQDKGHTIILNTYRSNISDGTLEIALNYLNAHPTITFKPIIATKEKLFPPPFLNEENGVAIYQSDNGENFLFIDDMQVDIPLMPAEITNNDMVDWKTVEKLLVKAGVL